MCEFFLGIFYQHFTGMRDSGEAWEYRNLRRGSTATFERVTYFIGVLPPHHILEMSKLRLNPNFSFSGYSSDIP